MTTMDQLQHLATLKREATSITGLTRYRDALYRTTDALTEPGALIGTAALILDAIIDHIAHDGPQQPLERSHTDEHTPQAHPDPQPVKRPAEAHTAP